MVLILCEYNLFARKMRSIKYLEGFYVSFRNSWWMTFGRCKNIPINSLYYRLALDRYIGILNKNVSTTHWVNYSVMLKGKASRKKLQKVKWSPRKEAMKINQRRKQGEFNHGCSTFFSSTRWIELNNWRERWQEWKFNWNLPSSAEFVSSYIQPCLPDLVRPRETNPYTETRRVNNLSF